MGSGRKGAEQTDPSASTSAAARPSSSPGANAAGIMSAAAVAPRVPTINDVSPDALLPRLLLDGKATEDYVAAFPRDAYRVYEVPELGKFYLEEFDDVIKTTLRQGRIWEPHIDQLLVEYVAPGSTALDVGAHIGAHTLRMAQLVGPEGRVYAFEPQKKIFRELVNNLRLNGITNVVPCRFAIGASSGVIEMDPVYVSADGSRNEGGAAVGHGSDKAELRTLDSFQFKHVSLVKIDVEKYEDPVLDGAVATIRANLPVILVEIQGGHPIETATPEFVKRIKATIAKVTGLGYQVKRVLGEDYLALPTGRQVVGRDGLHGLVKVSLKGAHARASSNDDLAQMALDGKIATRWHSGAAQHGGEWLVVDLGAPKKVRQIRLELGEYGYDFGRALAVDAGKNDESAYTEVLSARGDRVRTPNVDSPDESQRLTLPQGTEARFIRIRQTAADPQNYWSVAEIGIYE